MMTEQAEDTLLLNLQATTQWKLRSLLVTQREIPVKDFQNLI